MTPPKTNIYKDKEEWEYNEGENEYPRTIPEIEYEAEINVRLINKQ